MTGTGQRYLLISGCWHLRLLADGAWLRLQPEEFLEQNPVGLDTHKSFVKINEDGDTKASR
jgi:hypothetical protein